MVDPTGARHADDAAAIAPVIGPREVLDAAPDLIFCCDARGRFAWASSTFEFFAGYRPSELLGRPFTLLLPLRERRGVVRAFVRQMRAGRTQSGGDYTLVRRDGSRVDITARVRLYVRSSGERYFVGVARERAPWAEGMGPGGEGDAVAILEARVRELQVQLDEAREGDQLKAEVLATLSHEIRQPMDVVLSTSDALLRSTLGTEQRQMVASVRAATQALMTLVSDAYDHARLETGRMEIQSIDFDLRVTLAQVVGTLQSSAESRGLTCESSIDVRVPSRLRGDPGRLRQVLLNLGGSAVKAADRGRVLVAATRESEDDDHVTVLFRVSDPGLGVEAERRARAFREHRDTSVVARRGGSPELGLSIARRLVHLMGGLVGVEYEPDAGNTFWFRLTLEKQPAQAVLPVPPDVRLRGVSVLLADGLALDRQSQSEMLRAWGCEVAEATNGIEALDQIRAAAGRGAPFAIALADRVLEGLDGESFGSAVRADTGLDATRLVLTTRLGRPGDADRARELGFAAYLLKPLEPAQLFEALLEVLAAHPDGHAVGQGSLVTRHSLAEARRSRVRVLLVLDDPVNRLVMQSALNRVGLGVDAVASGREALERIESESWDLVVMDLNLPGVDGAGTARAIRARERGNWRTPILGLSSGPLPASERERCAAAGMDDVHDKTLDLAQLVAVVEHWTGPLATRAGEPAATSAGEGAPARLTVVSDHFDPPAQEPVPELPEGPAVDLEQLNLASMGLPELRTSMLQTWLGDALPRLQRLEIALEASDAAAAELEVHGLRGMSATIGATRCALLFGEMERRLRGESPGTVRALMAPTVEEVRRVEEFVARLERIIASEAA